MNKKKGFTLVEILAILIVLAIILVIAVPKILDVINKSGKKAFTNDVSELVGTSKLEYNEKLEGNRQDIWYYFEDGNQINYVESGELHFEGEKPSRGYILVTKDGEIELELVSSDEKWCASKELDDKTATIDTCKIKEKQPITLNVGVTNTTKSITLTVSPTDLSVYYYKLDDGEYESSSSNIKTYSNLQKNKTYKVTVKGCRKNETVCAETTVSVTLPELEKPKYTVVSVPKDQTATNGWATSRTVTIDYTQEKDVKTDYTTLINQYIYATTIDEMAKKVINNEWTKCENDTCTLPEFTSDVYIISSITDGYNELASSVQKLTKFDTQNPSAPVITGGSTSWTNTSRTISVSTSSTALSGIKKYQYYVSTSSTELSGGSWKDCTTSNISQTFTDAGTYYVFFRAQSYVEKYSEPSNVQVVKIDKTAPSVPTSVIRYTSSTGTVRTNADTWTNQTLWWGEFSATDADSGIDHYEYSTNCSGTKSDNLVSSYTYTSNMNYKFCIRAVDKVGNTSEKWSNPYYFKIDKTAPSVPTSVIRYTSSTGSVRTNADTWTNQTLWWGEFSATDADSGIDHYEYSTNCSGTKSDNLVSSYTYTSNMEYKFCIRAVDKVGNTSEAWSNPYYFKIDKTAPSNPTITYNGGSNSCSWKNNYNLTLASTDNVSLSHYEIDWDLDGVANTTTGANFVPYNGWSSCNTRFRAVDHVGNKSEWTGSQHIHMDTQAPGATTVTYNSGSNSCSWKNNYNISLSSSDNVGVAYYEIDWNGDSAADSTTGANFIPGNGYNSCNTRFRAVDHAGNRGAWSSSQHIHMDTQAPGQTTVNLNGYTSGTWTSSNVTQTASASDNIGIAYYQYSHDGSNVAGTFPNPWTITWNGQWNFYVRAIDHAGNIGAWSNVYTIRRGVYSQSSVCGSESYTYSCTGTCYKYSGGGTTCSGTWVSTSNCSGAYSTCCRTSYSCTTTCTGTRYKTCWHE